MSRKRVQGPESMCTFTYSDGRQCRMPQHSVNSTYCYDHERKFARLLQDELALEIFKPLSCAPVPVSSLTLSLTRLFAAVVGGRIGPKTGVALARIADTLLKTIPESNNEFRSAFNDPDLAELIRRLYGAEAPSLLPLIPPPADSSEPESAEP